MSIRKDASGTLRNRSSKDFVEHMHYNDKGELLCKSYGNILTSTNPTEVTCSHCLRILRKYQTRVKGTK